MTSKKYIIKLMQTIESLHSTVQGFCEEIAMLRKQKTEDDFERKRLMKLIEAKDGDIMRLTDKISDLLGKIDALTVALEDKTHQLATATADSTTPIPTLNYLGEVVIMMKPQVLYLGTLS